MILPRTIPTEAFFFVEVLGQPEDEAVGGKDEDETDGHRDQKFEEAKENLLKAHGFFLSGGGKSPVIDS
jgi:hypothetical protein